MPAAANPLQGSWWLTPLGQLQTELAATVAFSVTLDFVQEYRAGRAAERLRSAVAVRALVICEGRARWKSSCRPSLSSAAHAVSACSSCG